MRIHFKNSHFKYKMSSWSFVLGVVALFVGATPGRADCERVNLVDGAIVLKKQSGILAPDYNELISGGKTRGKLMSRTGLFAKGYDLRNVKDVIVATADQDGLENGTSAKVFDCDNNLIGSLEAKITAGFFSSNLKIYVRDRDSKILAVSDPISPSDETIIFKDTVQGSSVFFLEFNRPLIGPDYWKLQMRNEQAVDTRLALFLLNYRASSN